MTKLLACRVVVTALLNAMEMSAHYFQYLFPTLFGQWDFFGVAKVTRSSSNTLWQCLEVMGSIWKLGEGSLCFLESVLPPSCAEEVQSLLLILCIPNPACAGEISVEVLAKMFQQLLSGSFCLDLAGRGTLSYLVLVPRSMEGSKMP